MVEKAGPDCDSETILQAPKTDWQNIHTSVNHDGLKPFLPFWKNTLERKITIAFQEKPTQLQLLFTTVWVLVITISTSTLLAAEQITSIFHHTGFKFRLVRCYRFV